MDELDVGEFLKLYCENITTRFDGRVLCLTGFYRQKSARQYGEYFYDEIFSKESGLRITVKVTDSHREQLVDGRNYALRGYVNRANKPDKDSRFGINFHVIDVKGENKEVQLVHEEEYDLLKSRFERGFTDVKQLILDQFDAGFKVRLAIITGNESIVDQDFDSQFSDHEKFHIDIFRANLGNAPSLVEFIQNQDFDDYDLIGFMRGGGSGLDVFNDESLCQSVLDLEKPFITALGHQDDLITLSKIADKNLPTPSAFGTFLQAIGQSYDQRMAIIDGLQQEVIRKDQELLKKDTELEKITDDIRAQLSIRSGQLRALRLWVVILVLIVIGLGYVIYDKLLSTLL